MSQRIRWWLEYLDLCESPIERQMWAVLLHLADKACAIAGPTSITQYRTQREETIGDKSIRIDITAIVWNADSEEPVVKVAIELDGHDFHDRTKEQARRDKSRDRALTAKGWTVLRFTGSEVHADAYQCWADVFAVIKARAEGAKATG